MNTANALYDLFEVALKEAGRWSLMLDYTDSPPVRGLTDTTARTITIFVKAHRPYNRYEDRPLASTAWHEVMHAALNIPSNTKREELRIRRLEQLTYAQLSKTRKKKLRGLLRRARKVNL